MNTSSVVPDGTQDQLIREQLASGEMVRWLGQESRSRYFTSRIAGVVISLLITAFAGFFTVLMLFMNPNVLRGSVQGFLPVLIPLVIFLAATYGLVRAILSIVKGRPSLYVVTNQRAMLIEQGVIIDVKSYGADAIRTMQVTRRKNGSGKIIFERQASWVQDGEGRSQRRVVEIGFFGLPSVDEVCRQLRQIPEMGATLKVGGDALPIAGKPVSEPPGHFFALETSALHERLYKISIVSHQVCGAKIAGGFSSVGLKHMGEVSGYGFLFSPLASQIAKGEQKRETHYLRVNPLNPDFLAADKANFRYGSLEVDHITINEEYKTLDSGYNSSGRLEIHLRDGKVRKFWLTRNANPASVAELFQTNGIRVEATESAGRTV